MMVSVRRAMANPVRHDDMDDETSMELVDEVKAGLFIAWCRLQRGDETLANSDAHGIRIPRIPGDKNASS